MRVVGSIGIVLILSSGISAQPPKLEVETIIEAKGDYVTFSPKTDAQTIAYVGRSGVDPFPTEMLKDSKTFILSVRGLKRGDYHFTAIAIRQNEFTRADFMVRVPNGAEPVNPPQPQPEPQPPTPKPPEPKLDNAPVSTDGLHVAFIYQDGVRLNQNQFNTLYGQTVRSFLDSNCDRYNGQPQWRIIDIGNVVNSDPWKDALKRKRTSVPWVVVMCGKKYVYEGELTGTPEEFVKKLEQWKPKTVTDYCPNCPIPIRSFPSK